ncbi:FAD/NAD(P)-binding domain-containing protein [Hypoxylon trugodes]|uniref:FAD/NAD(P)-binding domain-containing protein n=1 Tax=Hypoxylon trugodes TaxID=326681 RepID=UPI0021946477|nr:FAD/NAD(P)-binding domain-containing protein [Hypoxylon trugodes]KAI1390531.1 FAD/NAD(P)-binding domain-containing protein [Hypoxylon trugodes]
MRVAIIGAGPSGLVTLKYLLAAEKALGAEPIETRLFESEAGVGGTFLARTYEDAELVSSRQLTCFSDFRCGDDEPDFLSAKRYVEYLNEYCTHFNLWPHMTFSCQVKNTEKRKEGGYTVAYLLKGEQHMWECDAVAVCSGLHVEPSIPKIEGIEKVPLVLHSSKLKTRDQFGTGKTVLVLGGGETGADVSLLAVTSPTKRVVMCHRNGFHIAPKRNPNPQLVFLRRPSPLARPQVPIDVSRASLFDTAYVHPWLRNSNLLWNYYDCYVKSILWTSWGTTDGSDQWIGGKPKGWSTSEIFFNKSGYKLSPYFNAAWKPQRPQSIAERIRSMLIQTPDTIPLTRGREVDLAPWPSRINPDGTVVFQNNGRPEYLRIKDQIIKPDIVVFCTGYTYEFPFLPGEQHNPRSFEGRLVRSIWPRDEPTLGFVGFVRPNLGAIPPLAEFQAQLWVLNLLAPGRVGGGAPLRLEDEGHYKLKVKSNARIRYGVDHESYAYQLAMDMGAAPSFGDIMRIGFSASLPSPFKRKLQNGRDDNANNSNGGYWYKLPLTWALSANFNTKFRLLGPWQWDGALELMSTELWNTVARRQLFFGHFTLSVIPMFVFGPISLIVFLYATLYQFVQRIGLLGQSR